MRYYPFALQDLPYDYDALAPALSENTLHFHHDRHLNTYVQNLNKALEGCENFHDRSLPWLLAHLEEIPESARNAVRNNGGGVFNHELYFSTLTSPSNVTKPSESLLEAINRDFGGFEDMIIMLKAAAVGQFGSGWAYVVADKKGNLSICSTPNQDVPDLKTFAPILTVDVWEHAYYLDYQNRRPDYCTELTSLLNWVVISRNYENRSFEE